MVRGLDKFKTHFAGFEDSYALIGGTACSVAMENAGLTFRATKDLDIVLCAEALTTDFVRAFWDFIQAGKYDNRQKSTGKRLFYRFQKPQDDTYPEMLELFSRKPDILDLAEGRHLTPIPVDEEVSSLSAILLDEDYYSFIQGGTQEVDGLQVVKPTHLIPIKACAWLDLSEREGADSGDIKKHKNDVFRLFPLLAESDRIDLPESIKTDFARFIDKMEEEPPVDLKDFGVRGKTMSQVLHALRSIYGISPE